MERVAILGSGMAGSGAAYRLHQEGVATVTYDKHRFHGGHTASQSLTPVSYSTRDRTFLSPNTSVCRSYLPRALTKSMRSFRSRPNNVLEGHPGQASSDLQPARSAYAIWR